MSERSVSLSSIVVAVKEILGCNLRDEAVILDLQSGVYYGLDPVGARIWELIQEPNLLSEVRDTILDEYEVEREQCENDLCAFIDELIVNGLVDIQN